MKERADKNLKIGIAILIAFFILGGIAVGISLHQQKEGNTEYYKP